MITPLKLRLRQRRRQLFCIPSLPTLTSRSRNDSRGLLKPIRARSQQGIDPTCMAGTLDQIDPVPTMFFEDIGYCVAANPVRARASIGLHEIQTPVSVTAIGECEFRSFVPNCGRKAADIWVRNRISKENVKI